MTRSQVRAVELCHDGLSNREISIRLKEEGFPARSRRTIHMWLSMPESRELLQQLEQVATDECLRRRRKLQEVALVKTAMFLDGVGNTVTVNGKTKIQEVKPETAVQLLKVLITPPAQRLEVEHSGQIATGPRTPEEVEAARQALIERIRARQGE